MIKKTARIAGRHMGKIIGALLIAGTLTIFLQTVSFRSQVEQRVESLLNKAITYSQNGEFRPARDYSRKAAELARRESATVTSEDRREELQKIESECLYWLGSIMLKEVQERHATEIAEAQRKKANFRLPASELSGAEKALQQAVEVNPKNAEAHRLLGYIAREKGLTVNAVRHLTAAVAQKPDYADALNDLGEAYFHMRQYDEAEEYFEKALIANKNLPSANLNLGMLLFYANTPGGQKENRQKAKTYLQKFIELSDKKGSPAEDTLEARAMLAEIEKE